MNNRNPVVDILKIISIIMIIITHDPYFVEHYSHPLCVFVIDMAVPIFIFISGYNYANSVINHGFTGKELYNIFYIFRKLFRFLLPYSLVFCVVMLLSIIFKGKDYSLCSVCIDYIKGGYGPGSYYTPIMIQFILMSPLFYIMLSRLKKLGLYIAFLVNLLYEIALDYGLFSYLDYSRIIIRYTFLISCGMYYVLFSCDIASISQKKLQRGSLISLTIGITYLAYIRYFHHANIFKRWPTTSMMVAFYIIPIIYLFEKKYAQIASKPNIKYIKIISSATYHIYLTQMTYYYVGLQRFIKVSIYLRILFSIIICILGGVMFYYLEKRFNHFIKNDRNCI